MQIIGAAFMLIMYGFWETELDAGKGSVVEHLWILLRELMTLSGF
jgi:hypothetical protein